MRRPLSRREFCVVAGVGVAAAACGNGNGGGGQDLAVKPSDMGAPKDLSDPTCADTNGKVYCGPATQFAVDDAKLFFCSHMFVCRDGGGLYALTSVCTHQGCDVGFNATNRDFECPCHQSVFDFNGNVVADPATLPLVHYAVDIDGNGDVVVDVSKNVPPGTRVGPGTGGTD